MKIFKLDPPEMGTSGLFRTEEGAKASAARQLEKFHKLTVEELIDDEDVDYYILTTELTWWERDEILRAQYCEDYAFTIQSVEVNESE